MHAAPQAPAPHTFEEARPPRLAPLIAPGLVALLLLLVWPLFRLPAYTLDCTRVAEYQVDCTRTYAAANLVPLSVQELPQAQRVLLEGDCQSSDECVRVTMITRDDEHWFADANPQAAQRVAALFTGLVGNTNQELLTVNVWGYWSDLYYAADVVVLVAVGGLLFLGVVQPIRNGVAVGTAVQFDTARGVLIEQQRRRYILGSDAHRVLAEHPFAAVREVRVQGANQSDTPPYTVVLTVQGRRSPLPVPGIRAGSRDEAEPHAAHIRALLGQRGST